MNADLLSETPSLEKDSLDNQSLLQRSIERGRQLLAHDPALRQAQLSLPALEEMKKSCKYSLEYFEMACRLYAERPALGYRARKLLVDEKTGSRHLEVLPEFRTMSYAELWEGIQATASGWKHESLAAAGEFAGICGFASPDYIVAESACQFLQVTSVPLQTNMNRADLVNILQETEMRVLVCSLEQLDLILPVLPESPAVRELIVMDYEPADDDQRDTLARYAKLASNVKVRTLIDLQEIGRKAGFFAPTPIPEGKDPIVSLVYTSGSTGAPKGAIFLESLWQTYWNSPFWAKNPEIPNITLNFMPLNHMAGRATLVRVLAQGGAVYFTLKSDMSTLFEDIRLARPTQLMLVPRVSSMIYQAFETAVIQRGPESEAEVMREMGEHFLGDRLLLLTTGTAPTSPKLLDFLKRCFQVPVFSGYGSTEAGGITFEDRIQRQDISEYKLVSIPELGYLVTDKPHPRGELRLKTVRAVPGYFKNLTATAGLFDEDGFLKTGDIVEEMGPDHVVWIDRVKNILKLSQGEFVSLWRLESVYSGGSPFLSQIFLYGTSHRSFLVGIVVPNQEALRSKFAAQIDLQSPEVKQLLRAELNRVARENQLQPYEIPRDFLVETERFTQENGLLTDSNKSSHPRLKLKYGARLEALYDALEAKQREDLVSLLKTDSAPLGEKVRKALQISLGITNIDDTSSFADLGGDSLNAVRTHQLIDELCGVKVPVALILNPSSNIKELVHFVEQAAEGKSGLRTVSFADVHGADAKTVKASDLALEKFLSPEEIMAAQQLDLSRLPETSKNILLTGANGFLGRFLTLEALTQLPKDGKLYCVVRASHEAQARQRLEAGFATAEPELRERFAALAAGGRLVVLPGNLMKPWLGLDEPTYARLSDEVDTVLHNGALVNHAFSYPQLFEPNVLGTVEIIRFALHGRPKAVSFLSSVGVAQGLQRETPVREEEDGRALWEERPVDSGYAVGYATSKWADEILLREAQTRFGLPVNIFRCGMILAHRKFLGQINAADFFTRLLAGVVYTGLAPRSFYTHSEGAHFDGLPVDFISAGIIGITVRPEKSYRTYHVVNPHWNDGVSLDQMVDWVAKAGYPVERIEDYQKWYERFGEKLRALDQEQQQHSPLPILYQWERPTTPQAGSRLDATAFRAKVGEEASLI